MNSPPTSEASPASMKTHKTKGAATAALITSSKSEIAVKLEDARGGAIPLRVPLSPQSSVNSEDSDNGVMDAFHQVSSAPIKAAKTKETTKAPPQPFQPTRIVNGLVKVVNNDPPVTQFNKPITHQTPESELPNGAEIHMIDGARNVHIPRRFDPRIASNTPLKSQAGNGHSKSSPACSYPFPKGRMETIIYEKAGILREMGPDPTGVKAAIAKAQAEAIDDFNCREVRRLGEPDTASPEDLEMARRKAGTEGPATVEPVEAPRKRIVIEVDDYKKEFPYADLYKDGEGGHNVPTSMPAANNPKVPTLRKVESPTLKGLKEAQKANSEDAHVQKAPAPPTVDKITTTTSKWIDDRDIKPLKNADGTGSNALGSEVPDGQRLHFSSDASLNLGDRNVEGNAKHTLADYTGGFGPAPVEWDSRAAYNNQSASHAKWIDRWVMDTDRPDDEPIDRVEKDKVADTTNLLFLDDTDMASKAYEIVDGKLQRPPEGPGPVIRDPSDEKTWKHSRETAKELVENWVANKSKKDFEEQEERELRRKEYWRVHNEYKPAPNPNVPKANIYLRPFKKPDAEQVAFIWNYYIMNTCACVETSEISVSRVVSNLGFATDDDLLPAIAAVLRSPGNKGAFKDGKYIKEDEKVVGFAYANGLGGDKMDALRYSVEFLLYTHPQYRRQGIGRCLVDMMLTVLDPAYQPHKGYLFSQEQDDGHYFAGGRRNQLRKICFVMPFDATDPKEYEMVKGWLCREWEFEEEAVLRNHGFKFKQPSKPMSVGYLSRFTALAFDTANVL